MPKDIKNTIRIIISFFCGMFFALFLVWIYSKLGPYDVRIKSFTENGSYVEYPQIKGLKNKEKQKKINFLLKEQIYLGVRDMYCLPYVSFSDPECVYDFHIEEGFICERFASFCYSFNVEGHLDLGEDSLPKGRKNYGVIIDMDTGEVLSNYGFMDMDNRLQYDIENSKLEKEDKDLILNRLNGGFLYETIFYVDKDKNIVFFCDEESVKVPYDELKYAIDPLFFDSLKKK